jgi:hypothetical protein
VTYEGREEATRDRVRRYLKENYADRDGYPLSEARLTELLTDHGDTLTDGERHLSYTYYVGDQVAEAARLAWAGADPDQPDHEADQS